MEAKNVIVWTCGAGGVEISCLVVAAAHDVVIGQDNAGDAGEEDGVGAEVGGEFVAGAEQVPGTHCQADESADVAAASDVEVAW